VSDTVRTTTKERKPAHQHVADDEFVFVPRALLAVRAMRLTDAMVLQHVHYRAARRHDVTAPELAQLSGLHRASCWRALERLRKGGWLDDAHRPAKQLPTGKEGSLKVMWADVREHGRFEGALLAQLRSLPALKKAKTNAQGTLAPPGFLGRLVGMCRDTARDVVARLATGDTVRSRLATRRGTPLAATPVLALTREGRTCAPRVRIRLPVERITATVQAQPPSSTRLPAHETDFWVRLIQEQVRPSPPPRNC